MSKRLENRVVVVTGGARGIGRATCVRLVEEGANVVVADRAGAEETARSLGDGAMALAVDVTNVDSVSSGIESVLNRFGHIDGLVNNAGITRDATLMKTSDEAWDAVIAVNLTGTFNMTRAVAPLMATRKSGAIVNASSIVGLYGNFGQSNYVATKAGVIGLTKVWARELGRKGIRVNCIAPGFISTEMTAAMPTDILSSMKDRTPLGRLGRPEDVAAAYAFLLSDDAAFINGQILGVDGGLVLGT
jgi:3-oxoacyl-[acyl-carrier protein] reductase